MTDKKEYKILTVRNIPVDVYRSISSLAKENKRSIQAQILLLLEKASLLTKLKPLDTASKIRASLEGRKFKNVVEEIRDERDR